MHLQGIEEVVTDKGYHSGETLVMLKDAEVRTYIPEKHQKGAPALGRQGRATTGGLCEPAARERCVWKAAATEAR